MNGTQERLRLEFVPSVTVPTLTGTKCHNGGCTREIYRGKYCFRCWAGVKWTSIVQRVENKNGNNPSYMKVPILCTKEEMIRWVFDNPPPEQLKIPSLDRIDSKSGYSLENIRWIEKDVNSAGNQFVKSKCLNCDGNRNTTNLYCKNCTEDYRIKWKK